MTVRIVQVGIGGFGSSWATEVVPSVPEVEAVGYVDLSAPALAALVEAGTGSADICFDSLDEALAATDPDAVLVTASLVGHVPAVRAALDAGRHVLVEKPFAPTVAEGQRARRAAPRRPGSTADGEPELPVLPGRPGRSQALVADGDAAAEPHAVGIDFRRFSGAGWPARRPPSARPNRCSSDMSIHHFDLHARRSLGRDAPGGQRAHRQSRVDALRRPAGGLRA